MLQNFCLLPTHGCLWREHALAATLALLKLSQSNELYDICCCDDLTIRQVTSTLWNYIVHSGAINIVEFPSADNTWACTGRNWAAPRLSTRIKLSYLKFHSAIWIESTLNITSYKITCFLPYTPSTAPSFVGKAFSQSGRPLKFLRNLLLRW